MREMFRKIIGVVCLCTLIGCFVSAIPTLYSFPQGRVFLVGVLISGLIIGSVWGLTTKKD